MPHKKEDNHDLIICHYWEQNAGHLGSHMLHAFINKSME